MSRRQGQGMDNMDQLLLQSKENISASPFPGSSKNKSYVLAFLKGSRSICEPRQVLKGILDQGGKSIQ
jgi:hypothetical protein